MDLLNDFTIIKGLGQGGFGLVLLVRDTRANKEYAVKLIPMQRSKESENVVREVATLAKMSNIEGVVKYHHSWYQNFDTPQSFEEFRKDLNNAVSGSIHLSECISSGSSDHGIEVAGISTVLFIKMDYFPGVNLKEWLRSLCNSEILKSDGARAQPWVHGQILLAFHKILGIVQRIHRMDIIHRDLKPENILFKDPLEVCICDFGLSKCVPGNHRNSDGSDQAQHTRDIGTKAYLAPELLRNPPLPHSFQSDTYALGLVFLEMLTIFGSDTESEKIEIFQCHKDGKIHEKAAKFKPETDLIQRLLCKDPTKRCSIEDALRDKLFNTVPFDCNVCSVSSIMGIECFKQHLEGKGHQKNLRRWSTNSHSGSQTGSKQAPSSAKVLARASMENFCYICQVPTTSQANFEDHLASKKHQKRLLQQNDSKVPQEVAQLMPVSKEEGGSGRNESDGGRFAEPSTIRGDVDDLKARMTQVEAKLDQILMALTRK